MRAFKLLEPHLTSPEQRQGIVVRVRWPLSGYVVRTGPEDDFESNVDGESHQALALIVARDESGEATHLAVRSRCTVLETAFHLA